MSRAGATALSNNVRAACTCGSASQRSEATGCLRRLEMSTAASCHYPLERREGEIERLHIQGEAMAPDSAIMLERIGVGAGWHCLDLGCGPGGITGLMSERVGASGRVVGLDADPVFVAHARRHGPPHAGVGDGAPHQP